MEAAEAFALPGPVEAVEPHPTGHINEAFLVVAGGCRFLLQRLNAAVFPDADSTMANIVRVTSHLAAKGEPTLTLVATADGTPSWRDADGAVWRMYEYISDVHPLEVAAPDGAAVVGRAYGRFHRLLADLEPACLRVSLRGFHDPARRLAALHAAVKDDACGRAQSVADELDVIAGLRDMAARACVLDRAPVRVAHNDAKAANLLVDDDGDRPPVVVDLDTVMPGSVLWDVGDMVRSTTGTVPESTTPADFRASMPNSRGLTHESRSGQPVFDVERYRALVEAYLDETGDLLTESERTDIAVAGPVITYEQAVRFLTDHVQGDVYFRIAHRGQNLDRARNQLVLLTSMLEEL